MTLFIATRDADNRPTLTMQRGDRTVILKPRLMRRNGDGFAERNHAGINWGSYHGYGVVYGDYAETAHALLIETLANYDDRVAAAIGTSVIAKLPREWTASTDDVAAWKADAERWLERKKREVFL